jgi:pyruvate/2-oxoglutarate dehydrogenase complex dihydrolipoamide dehydrogenase (E3) component
MRTEFDVIVIGMGVGGEEVAGRTADAGLDVLAVERQLIGGECPYWGCIPSKMMLRAAHVLAEARRVPDLAGSVKVEPDWSPVAQRIREQATDSWDDIVAVQRHESKGSVVVKGEASFTSPTEIEVDGGGYSARRGIVIATGTSPAIPPIEGLSEVEFWTNREAIETKEVPSSLVVVGGGAVGAELAQVFARFGASVTIVEMVDHLLPPEEPESGEALAAALRSEGVDVRTGVVATRVERVSDGVTVYLSDGSSAAGEKLLVATGRTLNLASLNLAAAGLDPEARWVEVDEHMRVTDGIWAVGDITGKALFTHAAVYQGRIAAADILDQEHEPADYRALPRVTFTDPEVAGVGLTEKDARAQGVRVQIGTGKTSSSARGWLHGPGAEHGVTKLVADADEGILVGASTVGPAAGEVLGLLLLAVKERTPIAHLRELIYPYPTFTRGIEDALRDLDL